MRIVKETALTVENIPLVIDFQYVSLENINFDELTVVFKIKTRLDDVIQFSESILNNFSSGAIYKIPCELFLNCYYCKCVKYLNVRTCQNIGISQVSKRRVKPLKPGDNKKITRT